MDYATARFASNGYHPTSVAEIVEGLGVGKGVFYWYFDSKADLFLAILADAQRDLRRVQRAALIDAQTPLERIEFGLRASIEWSITHRDYFSLVQFAATDERFRGSLRKGQKVTVADAARHIQDAIDAGDIPDRNATVLAQAMVGVNAHLVQLVHHGVVDDVDEVIETAVDFCLHGTLGDRLGTGSPTG